MKERATRREGAGTPTPDGRHGPRSAGRGGGAATALAFHPAPSGSVQPKLEVGRSDDPLEREADEAAERVVGGLSGTGLGIQRACTTCQDELTQGGDDTLRRDTGSGGGGGSPPPPPAKPVPGAGRPLDYGTRATMEAGFGRDFSDVRIHTGAAADRASRSIGARAYTLGQDVVFGAGEYDPASRGGSRLLAHELAHVTQQAGGAGRIQRQELPGPAPSAPLIFYDAVEAAYDPCAVDPGSLTNQRFVEERARAHAYISSHARGELRYFDYAHLWRELEADRPRRVRLGHSWLGEADITVVPAELVELIPGEGLTVHVAHAVVEAELGVPYDHGGSVVLSRSQFDDLLVEKGIEHISLDELFARAEEEGRDSGSFELPPSAIPEPAPTYGYGTVCPNCHTAVGPDFPDTFDSIFAQEFMGGTGLIQQPGSGLSGGPAWPGGPGLDVQVLDVSAGRVHEDDQAQRMAAAGVLGWDPYTLQPLDSALRPDLARGLYSDRVRMDVADSVRGAETNWRGYPPETIAQVHMEATQLNDLMPNMRVFDLMVSGERYVSVTASITQSGLPNLDWYDTKARRSMGDDQAAKYGRAVRDLQSLGELATPDQVAERSVLAIPDDHVEAARAHTAERMRANPGNYAGALDAQLRLSPMDIGPHTVTSLAQLQGLRQVDINTASAAQLQQLTGIGPARAHRIVAERTNNGPFSGVDDLARVPGIAEGTIDGLRHQAGPNPILSDQRFNGIVDNLSTRAAQDLYTEMGAPAQRVVDLLQFRRDTAGVDADAMGRFQRGVPEVFEEIRLSSELGSTSRARGAMVHRAGVRAAGLGAGMGGGVALVQYIWDPESHSFWEVPAQTAIGGASAYAGTALEEYITLRGGSSMLNLASRAPALAGPLSAAAPGVRVFGGTMAGGITAPAATWIMMAGTEAFTDTDFLFVDYAAMGGRTAVSGAVGGGVGTGASLLASMWMGGEAGSLGGPWGIVIGVGAGAIGYFVSDSLFGDDIEHSIRESLGEYGCTGRLPYGAGVQTMMGELNRGAYGYYSLEPGPSGDMTSVWVPPDPRYSAYVGPLDRQRSGESGGCQTCHDINYAWGQTIDLYGDPTPDRGSPPFDSRLPAMWDAMQPPELTPEDRSMLIQYMESLDAEQDGP